MKLFVTGVAGQLGHDVMNELNKRGYEGVGSDLAPEYSGIQVLPLWKKPLQKQAWTAWYTVQPGQL